MSSVNHTLGFAEMVEPFARFLARALRAAAGPTGLAFSGVGTR